MHNLEKQNINYIFIGDYYPHMSLKYSNVKIIDDSYVLFQFLPYVSLSGLKYQNGMNINFSGPKMHCVWFKHRFYIR